MTDTSVSIAQIKLKVKGVELLKSIINLPPATDFAAKEFQFMIHVESRIDPVQQHAIIITSSDVKADNKPDLLGEVSSACIFGIENFEEVIKKINGEKYDVPEQVMISLVSIAVSTLRGIMFDQFRGTYLHTAYLPLIDPKQFKPLEKE